MRYANPSVSYAEAINEAKATLTEYLFKYCEEQLGTTVDSFIATNGLVYLPDGSLIDGNTAQQILSDGVMKVPEDDLALAKLHEASSERFATGAPIALNGYDKVIQPTFVNNNSKMLYNENIEIPEKGTYIARIKGFESNGVRFIGAVYHNGSKVAYLPAEFSNLRTTVGSAKVDILGYDIVTQEAVVYKRAGKIFVMIHPTLILNTVIRCCRPSWSYSNGQYART